MKTWQRGELVIMTSHRSDYEVIKMYKGSQPNAHTFKLREYSIVYRVDQIIMKLLKNNC